jgi:peptidyl-prolyl cis-trans isomerase C
MGPIHVRPSASLTRPPLVHTLRWPVTRAAIVCLMAGCAIARPIPSPVPAPPTSTPTLSPSDTPEPLAAEVNGEPITLSDFQREVSRYEQAQGQTGTDLATPQDYRKAVLQSMIEERVAVQAAEKAGLTVSPDQLNQALQSVIQARGGPAGLDAWLAQVGYTRDEFVAELQRQILVQEITDQVAAQVSEATEQVHARYILVADGSLAEKLLSLLHGGANFASLAYAYSIDASTRASGGDLGWFPRGYLSLSEVETAAFSMNPNEISSVIQTKWGYAIVQTLEHSGSRPLSAGALQALRSAAVESWLKQQVSTAKVVILVSP